MLALIACCLIGICVVLTAEHYHSKQKIVTETTRKIIHMTHGVALVTLALLGPWWVIVVAEVVFFVLAIVARKYKLFKSQHDIGRKTWGEFYFPIGVIAIILLGVPKWVFVLSVLVLTFADAAAALVGTRYGKNNSYTVFGQKKSIAGSTAFFLVTVLLVGLTIIIAPAEVASTSNLAICALPFAATLAENLGAYGSDNLLILLTVSLVLRG